jgi:hypothetical protein
VVQRDYELKKKAASTHDKCGAWRWRDAVDLKRHAIQGRVDNLDGGRVATPVDWSLPACITDNSQVRPLDGWPNRKFRVLSTERNAP